MTFLFARFDQSKDPVHNRTSIDFSDDGAKASGLRITQKKIGGPYTIELSQFETVWRSFKKYRNSQPELLEINNLNFKNFSKRLSQKMNNLHFEVEFASCQISAENSKLFNCGYKKGETRVIAKTIIDGQDISLIAIKSRILIDNSINSSGETDAEEKFAVDVALRRAGKNYHFRVKTPGHNISTGSSGSPLSNSSLLDF